MTLVSGQTRRKIEVASVGGWKYTVDSAINLILYTDLEKYGLLMKYCRKVDFGTGKFSTTEPPNTIVISSKDMELNSVNNVAAVLIHESYHLYYFNEGIKIGGDREELECYRYEYDFLSKLPTIEDWLFRHEMNQIIYYSNRVK